MTEGEILADLRRQCGRWADDDAIQEAMTRAIELDPSARGARLRDIALTCLQEVREGREAARKRGAPVRQHATGYADQAVPTPIRRKQAKKPRQPRGVVTSHAFDTGVHVIPTCDGVVPDDSVRSACALIAPVLRLGAWGEPLSKRVAELALEVHQELFGVAPDHHWAHVLVDEIGVAKAQMLRNTALDNHRDIPEHSCVTLTPTGHAASRSKPVSVPIMTMTAPSAPGRAMRAQYQQTDEAYELRNVEVLGCREVPMTYSNENVERAQQILAVVRLRLMLLPWPQQLPSYADDPLLVAWLYRRAGFEGRGGQEVVQNSTLCGWLSDPSELAGQIERYVSRRAERCTDEEAEVLEQGLLELAGLVRDRAGLGSNGARQAGL